MTDRHQTIDRVPVEVTSGDLHAAIALRILQSDLLIILNTATSIEALFEAIMDGMSHFTKIQSATLYLTDYLNKDLEIKAYNNLSQNFREKRRIIKVNSEQWRKVHRKKPVYTKLDDRTDDTTRCEEDISTAAAALIPILHGAKVIGCLFLTFEPFFDVSPTVRKGIELLTNLMAPNLAVICQQEQIISEEKHRAFFESAAEAFIIADYEGCIVEVNPAACVQYGYTKNEMVQLKVPALLHTDFHHKFSEFRQALHEEGHYTGETVDVRSDGSTFFAEVHGSEIICNSTPHLLVVVRDITEQKETARKIQESVNKFKNLFDAVSIPLCYVREDGTIESFNARFTQLLGYTKEDIPTLHDWWKQAYPDQAYRSWVIENWDKAVQESIALGKDIKSDTYRVTCKSGEVRQIIIAGITVGTDFLATFIDVTEQRKAEELIIREKEFSESVLDAMPGIFYLFDQNGKFVRWNKTFSEISGIAYADIAERSPLDFIAPKDREKIAEAIQKAFISGALDIEAEFLSIERGGIPFYFTCRRVELNNAPHLLGVGVDITERKKIDLALIESENRLSKAILDSPFPIMIHAEDGDVIQISKSWSEATGYSLNDISTTGQWLQLAYGMDKEVVAKVLDNLFISDTITKDGEFEIRCSNGEKKIWDFSSSSIGRMADGRKLVVSMANDVTERKRAEERVKKSESNLKTILDSMPFGTVLIGQDKDILLANKAALQLMNYGQEDNIVGLKCHETFCPECAGNCPIWDKKSRMDRSDRILKTKDKKAIPVLKSSIPIVIDDKEVLLETFVDISRLKELEVEKDKALSDLGERMKEIKCLYQINEVFSANSGETVAEKMQHVARIIPDGWQFPQKTAAELVLDGQAYQSSNFKKSGNFIERRIVVEGVQRGHLKVNLFDLKSNGAIFLHEEEVLLKAISESIANYLSRLAYIEALKDSEEKFRSLLKHSPIAEVITNMDGDVELVNDSFSKIIGYTTEDIQNINDWWEKAYPDPEYRQKIKRNWESSMLQAAQSNSPTPPHEAKIRCKNGQERIFNAIGNIIGDKILLVFNDLTDRIRAEEERDRFFKVSLDLLCVAGTDGYFKQMNPAWHEVLGWSLEELQARPFYDFIHPEDVLPTQQEVEQLAVGEPTIHFTNRYRCKDGTFKWLNWNVVPFGENLYASATNVTELKNAQEDLAALYERLNLALEGGNVGVWEWDLQTDETIWDERMEQMFGLQPGTFDGTYAAFVQRLYPEDIAVTEKAIRDALHDIKPYDIVYRSISDQGEIRYINAKAVVVKNEKSENLKMIGVCTDVTEIKNAEQYIKKIAEELARSNEQLEQFAYVASHDLQEPLRMVSSFTQLLEKKYKGQIDETANKYIHYAVDGANRMQKLINDLLDYSRISSRGADFALINSGRVLQAAIHALDILVAEKQAVISYDRLPDISADESQIHSLFLNLIGNSLKFARKNIPPKIHISSVNQKDYWSFSLKDNGIGISSEFKEKIFVIFQRLHGRDVYPGTGIGLSICKRIVNRHGGEIWFESVPGAGTTFHFTIKKQQEKLKQYIT